METSGIFPADVSATSKLFWLYVLSRGGEIAGRKQREVAAALGVHRASIISSARELESAGWMAVSNRRQGCLQTYRCLVPKKLISEKSRGGAL